jgi:hypothetical protein
MAFKHENIVKEGLPDGWGMLISFSVRDKDDRNGSHGVQYMRLQRACESNKIRAYKHGNMWVVNLDDANKFIKKSSMGDIAATLATAAETDSDKIAKRVHCLEVAACKALDEVREEIGCVYAALLRIKDAIVDLKTPAVVEPKQEVGPY